MASYILRPASEPRVNKGTDGTVSSNRRAICASVSRPEAISLLCKDLLVDTMTGVDQVFASLSSALRFSLALSLPCDTQ